MKVIKGCVAALGILLALSLTGIALGASGDSVSTADETLSAPPRDLLGDTELKAERTATSETFRLPGGLLETRIHEGPIHYREDGQWKPLDLGLSRAGDGSVRNGANRFDVVLPERLESEPVRFSVGEHWVSSRLLHLGSDEVDISGNKATYETGRAGVDVGFTSLPEGIKEEIRISDPSQPSSYEFKLSASPGLHPELTEAGSIEFRDSDEAPVVVLPAPIMVDSAEPRPSISTEVHYDLAAKEEGAWLLTVQADREWIEAKERILPVKIDPTLRLPSPASDCFIKKDTYYGPEHPGSRDCSYEYLVDAHYSGQYDQWYRSLLRFDLSPIPPGALVSSATLGLYTPWAITNSSGVEARRLTKNWTATANWATYDGTSTWAMPGGDYSVEGTDIPTGVRGPQAGWWNFTEGLAPVIQDWVAMPASNYGVLVKIHDDPRECSDGPNGVTGCVNRDIWFRSSESTTVAQRPYLDVTYSPAPKVTTEAASVVKSTSAALNAAVNPNGLETTYQFEYGPDTSYGTKVPLSPKSIGSGTASVPVSEPITGLSAGTTYHFRISATNSAGTSDGEDRTFTTAKAPLAITGLATEVQADEATLSATVNPHGATTTYYFEYGPTAAYGSKIPAAPKGAGSSYGEVNVSETPAGLAEGSEYHFRVVATNEIGTTYGADKTFETPVLPDVTTESAVGVDANEAILTGEIDPNGEETEYKFEYGPTTAYGTTLTAEEELSGSEEREAEEGVSFLEPETTYHYRLVATSDAGTVLGADKTVTTSASSVSPQQEAEEREEETVFTGKFTGGVPNDFVNLMWDGETETTATKWMMNMVRGSGAKMLRIAIGEPEETSNPVFEKVIYNQNHIDSIFQLAANRGITLLPHLGHRRLPDDEGQSTRPAWRAFVKEVVERYGRDGSFWKAHPGLPNLEPKYWEIWNEPNFGRNGKFDGTVDPQEFGDVLKEAADVIHSVDKNAQIVMGGLLTVGKKGTEPRRTVGEFIRQLNHDDAYDALSLHPYAFKVGSGASAHAPSIGEVDQLALKVRNNLQEARTALNSVGNKDKKIWITEIGWPVEEPEKTGDHPPVTPQVQKALINSTFNMIKANSGAKDFNIENVFYYNIQDDEDPEHRHQKWDYRSGLREEFKAYAHGNYQPEGRFRPAWQAFQNQAGYSGPQFPRPPKNERKGQNIKSTKVVVNDTINPYGSRTKYWIKWGPGSSGEYTDFTLAQEVEEVDEGDVDHEITLDGLEPEETYHYRVVAENDAGETTETCKEPGNCDYAFTTPPSTSTSSKVKRVLHGQPGWMWIQGWVKEGAIDGPDAGPGLSNVDIHVQFKQNGQHVETVKATTNGEGFYQTGYVSRGEGEWEVFARFPGGGELAESESFPEKKHLYDGVRIVAKHSGKCMDIFGVQKQNGAAVMHGECLNPANSQNQVFTLIPQGNHFQIAARHSGRCLDVVGLSVADGAGIQQWDCLGHLPGNQLFEEVWWGESQYAAYVVKQSGKCLDVQNASQGWGPFQQWGCNGFSQQLFRLEAVDSAPIPTELFLTKDQEWHGSPGMFGFHGHLQAGAYPMVNRIVHVEFDKADISGWKTEVSEAFAINGNNYYEYRDFALDPGNWQVRARFAGNSEFAEAVTQPQDLPIKRGNHIKNRHSDQCLSLSQNLNQNGQPFVQWPCSGSPQNGDGQVFSFWPMGNGWYDIKVNGTNKCVDVSGASTADGAQIQLWSCLGAGQLNQHWDREKVQGQEPWIGLMPRHTGNKCMEVGGFSKVNGAKVNQWNCVWGGNQQWKVIGVVNP